MERLLNLRDLFTHFLKGDPAAGFIGVSACVKCSACTDLTAGLYSMYYCQSG